MESNTTKVIEIYTDGSHQRSKDYLGIGAFCKYQEIEFSHSATCDRELLNSYDVTETTCSSPTAELMAFAEVLKLFCGKKIPKDCVLIFYADYIGVKNWIEGSWKAKKPYIIKIRDICLQRMKEIGCKINIYHVKGHSGNISNDRADKLATNLNNFSNFSDLLALL